MTFVLKEFIRWQENININLFPVSLRSANAWKSLDDEMEGETFRNFCAVIFSLSAATLISVVLLTVCKWIKGRVEREKQKQWWKEGVIYHIYPRSFQDSNGDGNGDLKGITNRLDYFEFLGIKILYLSPIFKSPMVDNGYDVSDFEDIDPIFGNLKDFDELLREVHAKGMKLILDFVPNHTSDQHSWFLESRSSKLSPYRNWYVWHDPAPGGGPPNNWVSVFGGSAWSYDVETEQYYLHQFCPEQPDLNLRNAEVRKALNGVLRFWLDRGVDGFRVDAVPHLIEDDKFRDEPTKPEYDPLRPNYEHLDHIYTKNLDDNHHIVQEWRGVVDAYKDSYRILIGEIFSEHPQDIMSYYGSMFKSEFDFPFNFVLFGLRNPISAREIFQKISDYLGSLPKGAWPNWVLGNHDVPRICSKVDQEYCSALNVLLLTLPGTAITYYGEEIGMTDAQVHFKSNKDFRDPQRSPMQWSDEKNAGFSSGVKTWLPVAENCTTINVEAQKADPASPLQLYKELMKLRSLKCFEGLNFKVVHVDTLVLAYIRWQNNSKYLVIINFGNKIWKGRLEGIEGSGIVKIDSEMKKTGNKVQFQDVFLNKAQALVIKVVH